MKNPSITKFIKERNAALLSMDEKRIRKFMAKYNPDADGTNDPLVFWAGIHKAITAVPALGLEVRMKSKAWLTERGMQSADDGDLDSANVQDEGSAPSTNAATKKTNQNEN